MADFAQLGRQFQTGPMAESLKKAAASQEGQRVMRSLDADAVEKAAKQGDMQALKGILSTVLASSEGQALVRQLKQSLEGK